MKLIDILVNWLTGSPFTIKAKAKKKYATEILIKRTASRILLLGRKEVQQMRRPHAEYSAVSQEHKVQKVNRIYSSRPSILWCDFFYFRSLPINHLNTLICWEREKRHKNAKTNIDFCRNILYLLCLDKWFDFMCEIARVEKNAAKIY